MSEISKLQVYSLGLVAVNKALDSDFVEITPIEDLPMLNGELSDNAVSVSVQAKDSRGSAYQSEVRSSATVKAKWLPMGYGNRKTSPDVRRGERVVLYRFADTDQFWWVTQGQDMHLRKLETVIWGISATRDESAQPSPENMYWIEWSSHKKLIHLHTSKADGEPYAYDLQLNTKDGVFIFQDDDGQKFWLDSKARTWKVENRDGSFVEINKREIFEHAPDLIRRTSKRIEDIAEESVLVKAGQTVNTDAGQSISNKAGQTITSQASTEITHKAPLVELDGEVESTLNLKIKGDMTAANGGDLDNGLSFLGHVHGEHDNGGPTDPPMAG